MDSPVFGLHQDSTVVGPAIFYSPLAFPLSGQVEESAPALGEILDKEEPGVLQLEFSLEDAVPFLVSGKLDEDLARRAFVGLLSSAVHTVNVCFG